MTSSMWWPIEWPQNCNCLLLLLPKAGTKITVITSFFFFFFSEWRPPTRLAAGYSRSFHDGALLDLLYTLLPIKILLRAFHHWESTKNSQLHCAHAQSNVHADWNYTAANWTGVQSKQYSIGSCLLFSSATGKFDANSSSYLPGGRQQSAIN